LRQFIEHRSRPATKRVRRAGSEGSAEPTAISCASIRRRSVLPRDHRRVIETVSIFSSNASRNLSIGAEQVAKLIMPKFGSLAGLVTQLIVKFSLPAA